MLKKLPILLPVLLGVAVCFTNCAKRNYVQPDAGCHAMAGSDTVVLTYQLPATFFSNCKNPLHTVLTNISDSRCPTAVVCIWAGKLSVTLKLDSTAFITLEPGQFKDTLYQSAHYRFTLIDVIPHPSSQPQAPVVQPRAILHMIKTG